MCVYGKAIDWEISNGQTNRNPCWLFKWQQKDHKFGRIFPSDSIFRNLWNKRYFQFDYGRKTLLDISWLLIALSLSLSLCMSFSTTTTTLGNPVLVALWKRSTSNHTVLWPPRNISLWSNQWNITTTSRIGKAFGPKVCVFLCQWSDDLCRIQPRISQHSLMSM